MLSFLLIISSFYGGLAQDVKLSGRITHPKAKYLTFVRVSTDLLSGKKDTVYQVPLDSVGRFNTLLKVPRIESWMVEYGEEAAIIDLQPGNNLNLVFREFDYHNGYQATGDRLNDLYFMGALEKSYDLDQKYNVSYTERIANTKDLNENLQLRLDRSAAKISFLDAYNKKHPLTKAYYTWKKDEFTYEPYLGLIMENLNDPMFANSAGLFETIEHTGLHNDIAAVSSENYLTFLDFYTAFKTNRGSFQRYQSSKMFMYGLEHFSGLTKDVFLTRQMLNMVPIDSLYEKFLPIFKVQVSAESMLSAVNLKRAQVLEARTSVVKDGNIKHYGKLSALFDRYKGKSIYVDFWASWCGPCRREMPASKALRKKFEGKDVVFLYLGYNDQPDSWMIARKELGLLEGEHILLNKEQMDEARKAFKIGEIPHYAIINNKGEMVEQKTSGPGLEQTRLLLERLSKK